jgi:Na+/H+ antiporter NhaA
MVGVFYLKYFLYLCGMKMNLPPFLDYGIRVIAMFLLIFISVEVDRFAFGMMNVSNTISFGLGVSLFLGSNIGIFYLCYEIVKSIFTNQKQENQ